MFRSELQRLFDVSNAASKEVWPERNGASHYYFVWQDVLFMVLNGEDGSSPELPAHMKESIEPYNRLQLENPVEAQRMLHWELFASIPELECVAWAECKCF